MKRKLASIVLAGVLVFTLSPATALAEPLVGATIDNLTEKTALTAQEAKTPKKVAMRVITGVTAKQAKIRSKTSLAYNGSGLVKKSIEERNSDTVGTFLKTCKLSYSNAKLNKVRKIMKYASGSTMTSTLAVSPSSTKRLVKVNRETEASTTLFGELSFDKAGNCTASTTSGFKVVFAPNKSGLPASSSAYHPSTKELARKSVYKYTSREDIKRIKTTHYQSKKAKRKLGEDDRRDLLADGVQLKPTYTTVDKWSLSYRSGCLVKAQKKEDGVVTSVSYSYKTVKVPKALVKTVEQQQWALRNADMNGAFLGADIVYDRA